MKLLVISSGLWVTTIVAAFMRDPAESYAPYVIAQMISLLAFFIGLELAEIKGELNKK